METVPLYHEYSVFLRSRFSGKVQKIAVNAGFTCPNRDGTVGWGGCTYCNNRTFNPAYCNAAQTVSGQLAEGKAFFSRKYPDMKYLAYFQAYTNTYASLDALRALYEEALSVEGVVGLVIATRPDCMPDALLDYLEQLAGSVFVLVEYGIESVSNQTLKRINRGHTFQDTCSAVNRTASRGIPVGGHLILGLPGETPDDLFRQAEAVNRLPLTLLKLHQLQLIRGTRMAAEYAACPSDFHLFGLSEYMDTVIGYIRRLRPGLVLERFVSQSPKEWLLTPDWGLKNYQFTALLQQRMRKLGVCQGDLYRHENGIIH